MIVTMLQKANMSVNDIGILPYQTSKCFSWKGTYDADKECIH